LEFHAGSKENERRAGQLEPPVRQRRRAKQRRCVQGIRGVICPLLNQKTEEGLGVGMGKIIMPFTEKTTKRTG